MKGIVLAGGSGTRLYPITEGISKQLIPVYDKPMVYYPLSVLMLAGIKDILIITTPDDQQNFIRCLGDGTNFGLNLSYAVQPSPDGLAQAFLIGEEFINGDSCALVLCDNIFFGGGFSELLKSAVKNTQHGYTTVFGIQVPEPSRFGIMELDNSNKIISVEEKPQKPKSNIAITGLYFYPSDVVEKAKQITPSARGELEITSLNELYLNEERLLGNILGGGFSWYDTGTFDSLSEASLAVKSFQNNRGCIIACLEQIAYNNNWIDEQTLKQRVRVLSKNKYGSFLNSVLGKDK